MGKFWIFGVLLQLLWEKQKKRVINKSQCIALYESLCGTMQIASILQFDQTNQCRNRILGVFIVWVSWKLMFCTVEGRIWNSHSISTHESCCFIVQLNFSNEFNNIFSFFKIRIQWQTAENLQRKNLRKSSFVHFRK